MEERLLNDINHRLGLIIGLLSSDTTKDFNKEEKVVFLFGLGLGKEEIGKVCGILPKTVGEMLSRLKKKGKLKR